MIKEPKVSKDGNSFVIKYTYKGEQIRCYGGYESEEQARAIAKCIYNDIAAGIYDESREKYKVKKGRAKKDKAKKQISPHEAISQYMDSGLLKESTYKIYLLASRKIPKNLSNDPSQIRDYISSIPIKNSLKNRIMSCISASYKHLGITWVRPPTFSVAGACNANSIPRRLTKDEIDLLLDLMSENPVFHYFIKIALYTGARPGEIVALTWDDYDPCTGLLRISKNVTSVSGKQVLNEGSKNSNHRRKGKRSIPCSSRLKKLLEEIEGSRVGLILKPFNDKKYFDYRKFSDILKKRSNTIPSLKGITPYNFRDTFIFEQVFDFGFSIDVVAAWCDNSANIIRTNYLNQEQISVTQTPR